MLGTAEHRTYITKTHQEPRPPSILQLRKTEDSLASLCFPPLPLTCGRNKQHTCLVRAFCHPQGPVALCLFFWVPSSRDVERKGVSRQGPLLMPGTLPSWHVP